MSAVPKHRPAVAYPAPARGAARAGAATATAPRRQRHAADIPDTGRASHLKAVAAPQQARSIVPFAALCVGIIVASLAAVLLINIVMTEGAYERRDLKLEIAQLAQQHDDLVMQLEANSAPQQLAQRASDLGMVPADTLGFVSLQQGVVLEARTG
ncbi:hypothetical protein [Demequina capsici]|uniref:Cell division protein FtsL n=1 Tax=Demequina capsici TaxID=3075620 RepID=A0AA96JC57_9MICO|nr:hypothetical protein [Demequina sp. OYTSA14]WNM23354.1 hypothetical protein RN606_08235 [Demequina sp. OYTSA14]